MGRRASRHQRRDGIPRRHLGLQIADTLVDRIEAEASRRQCSLSEVAEDAIAWGLAAGLIDRALEQHSNGEPSARSVTL